MLENLVWHALIAVILLLLVAAPLARRFLVWRALRAKALTRLFGPQSIQHSVLRDLIEFKDDRKLDLSLQENGWQLRINSRGLKRVQFLGLAYYILQAVIARARLRPGFLVLAYTLAFAVFFSVVAVKLLIKPHPDDVRSLIGFETFIPRRLAKAARSNSKRTAPV